MKILLSGLACAAFLGAQGCAVKGAPVRGEPPRAQAAASRRQAALAVEAEERAAEDAAVAQAAASGVRPVATEEARDLMAKGKAYVAQARGVEDYERAVYTMKKALALVPGWASGYYNLALAEEGAGRWADAQRHLRYYLKLMPEASDKEAVRMKLAELSILEERAEPAP